ncbi:MAG: hypothetical protein ABI211_28535 [Vicinamibacterales bacterium]
MPTGQAASGPDAEAIAPLLLALQDPLLAAGPLRGRRCQREAGAILRRARPLIMSVELGLRHRELASEVDVEA